MGNKFKSSAEIIPMDKALGKVLAHDITEIRPGNFKGAAFKKGHIVREQDIPHLRRLGKEHLFVLDLGPGELHEDEAALRLVKAFAGPGIQYDDSPSEGKISLKSAHQGLLKVNVMALMEINLIPGISRASRHNNGVVDKGEIVAATRAIPLIIEEKFVNTAVSTAQSAGGIFSVKKLAKPDTGLVITGNEVYHGLINDKFAPLIRTKLQNYGCRLQEILFAPDDKGKIREAITNFLEADLGLILVAGGMSVDPDDVSRMAISEAGAEDVVYGTPVLPGAMFLSGTIGNVPVLGLPACGMFHKITIFDLILPRILAGEKIGREELARMGHGGLCRNCKRCQYPVCNFGK